MIDPRTIRYPLQPEELTQICAYLYDRRHRWKAMLAHDVLTAGNTVRNWSAGRRAIPGPVVACLRFLVERKNLKEISK